MFCTDMEELSRGISLSPQGLFAGQAQPSPCVAGALLCCTAQIWVTQAGYPALSPFPLVLSVKCQAGVISHEYIMIHGKLYFKIKSWLQQNSVTAVWFYFFMFSFIVVFLHVLSCPLFLHLSLPTPFSFLFSVLQSWATLTLNCVNNKLNFVICMF